MPSRTSLSLAGFGTFERLELPAVYNPELHVVSPPTVTVMFRSAPEVATSVALVESVMRTEDCTSEQAEEMLLMEGRGLAEDLRACRRCAFEGLGEVYLDSEGDAAFRTSPDFVDAYGRCWLPKLELDPLHETAVEAPAAKAVETAVDKDIFRRNLRIASSWAAAIMIVGVVAFVMALVNRYDRPEGVAVAGTMVASPAAVTPAPAAEAEAPLMLVFRTPADGVDTARVRPVRSTEPDGPYCLIVASLANADEAAEFIAQRASAAIPLYLLETQGRYRVYALAGDDPASVLAEAAQAGIDQVYPNVWVCRR